MRSHRIVLTGGPGGGKSTAADLMRRELGDQIIIVPETATILFAGGFPRHNDIKAIKATQRAIFHVQRSMEEIQRCLYPDRTLLCDRGVLDGAVYWPEGVEDFLFSMETDIQTELRRYDTVIFFESAAVGDLSIEGGNPVRIENNQKAVELDKKLHAIWSQHENFTHIPHQPSFMKKLQKAVDVIKNDLNGRSESEELI